MTPKKKRNNPSQKVISELQKEINSECPFCLNNDVGHFQTHHIDENPANNSIGNLLRLCPLCHSKITKGDIPLDRVLEVKASLQSGTKKTIEFVSVSIDNLNCSWNPHEENEYAFYDEVSAKSPFPILDFKFINHSNKTIMLKAINIKAKVLQGGINGLPAEPSVVKPLIKYAISLNSDKIKYIVPDPIQVPAHNGFRFQVELYRPHYLSNTPTEVEGRWVLNFSFSFSDSITVESPKIFLNCKDETEKVTITILS